VKVPIAPIAKDPANIIDDRAGDVVRRPSRKKEVVRNITVELQRSVDMPSYRPTLRCNGKQLNRAKAHGGLFAVYSSMEKGLP
jgi:hypothetical protein